MSLADERRTEWNSHVRGAYIAIWLKGGSKLSTAEIVKLTGLSKQGVEFMMEILGAYMPIVRVSGKWQWMDDE
jgi:hypothetical protein